MPRQESICVAYGATVTYAKQLMYGKQSEVTLDNTSPLFAGFPEKTLVARYHSLAAVDLPECLKVTAITPDGEIMAVQHRDYPIYGVQSHPESIMTPLGKEILKDAVLQ